jgi:hypothetical protein
LDTQYHFDEHGQPVAIEIDGTVQELSPVERAVTPGKTIQEVRDLNTTLRSTVESMKDSYDGDSILVDVEATHGGYSNKNNYFYVPDGMEKYVDTWTEPYEKPYLAESPHDLKNGDPKGRVQDAEMIWTGPDTGFHSLDVQVGDDEEMQRIIDGRALTVSVGSTPAETVECSVCGKDLFHDGRGSKTFQIEKPPPKKWLDDDAPGVFGAFGKTNRDFWDYHEDDDGNHICRCRHIRGSEAPMGGDSFEEIDWMMHGNRYRELSRVNLPADQNKETGEFAHITGVAEQNDSLDGDTLRNVLVSDLSRVEDHSPVNFARHQIVPSEDDLYVPTSATDALDVMGSRDDEFLFDTGLWVALTGQNPQRSFQKNLSEYVDRGGRVIGGHATDDCEGCDDKSRDSITTATDYEDAQYSVGDKVKWSWQGSTVHGKVSDVGDSFTVSGNKITGDEGEAVYKIDEWDDDAEEFNDGNVAKPESSLSKSDKTMEPSDSASGPSSTEGLSATDQEYEVGEETIDITPPDYMQSAAQAYLDASDENMVPDECGSGTGSERASQIVDDEVGPEVIDEVAAYLTSHEEDLTADGNPSGWGEEEWSDCGNAQYAAWGGGGSGDALGWAQDKANEVAEAKGEDIPYEDRISPSDMLNLPPGEFGRCLRSKSDLTDQEKESLDRLYVQLNMDGKG